MDLDRQQVTTVTIYNRDYRIKSGGDPEYVRGLAELVDRKMMELSLNTPTVDTLKVAVLAALNIADDCLRARKELENLKGRVADRAEKMAAQLENACGEPS